MKNIQELDKLDLFKSTFEECYDKEKSNYKKVLYWKSKNKINIDDLNEHSCNFFIRTNEKYCDIDFDFFKHLTYEQAISLQTWLPNTLSFGRNGRGHFLYEIENPKTFSKKCIAVGGKTLIEFRCSGCYSLFRGKITDDIQATLYLYDIKKIKFENLWELFHEIAFIAAITILAPGNREVINNYLIPIIGELASNGIGKEKTEKLIFKFLELINRKDRQKETKSQINSIYKSKKFSNLFSKSYPLNWEQSEKFSIREIIKSFNYENKKTEPFEINLGNDIFNTELVEPSWIIPGMLPEGLCIIASRPKVGKSWLGLGIARAVVTGSKIFNRQPEKGGCLYFALEDNVRRIKRRFESMGITPEEDKPSFSFSIKNKMTKGFENDLEDYLKKHLNTKCVIIDTYKKAAPITKNGNTLYEIESENLSKIHQLALNYRIAVIIIHHTRKPKQTGEEDTFDSISGSTGMQSIADTIWVLETQRKKYKNPIIQMIGRDIEQQEYEAYLNPNFEWEILGKPGTLDNKPQMQKDIERAIRELTETSGSTKKEVYPKDVCDYLKLDTATQTGNCKKTMKRMLDRGELLRGSFSGSYKLLPM